MEKQTNVSTIESSPDNKLYYGWVIVASFLVSTIILYGTLQSFGVFFKSIESAFSLSRTLTSAISSTNSFVSGAAALIIGRELDKYGPKRIMLMMGIFTGVGLVLAGQTTAPWQLFITYGILLPVGIGAVYVVPSSAISRWFDKRRGLALGIAGSASGLGTMTIIPLSTYLIDRFDWRTAYVILGIIALAVIIPISRLLKSAPNDVKGSEPLKPDSPVRRESTSTMELLGSRNFWFVLISFMLFGACLLFMYAHFVPHITDMGFTPSNAAGVLSVFGISSIAGRIIVGATADRVGRKVMTIIVMFLLSGALLWLIAADELWMLYFIGVIFGFSYSGFSSAMGAYIGDIFGLSRIGTVFGLLEIGFATGAAAGPALGGLIFDSRGSYFIAFIVFGIAPIVVSLLVSLLREEPR